MADRALEDALFQAKAEYVNAIAAIDLTRCPPDFQTAFLRHRQAWRDQQALAGQYRGWTGKIGGVFELAVTGQNPSDRFDLAAKAVNDSFIEVQRVALTYSVQLESNSGSK